MSEHIPDLNIDGSSTRSPGSTENPRFFEAHFFSMIQLLDEISNGVSGAMGDEGDDERRVGIVGADSGCRPDLRIRKNPSF